MQLRKQGNTYQEIADRLGYGTPVGAYNAVKAELNRIVREPAEDVLRMELERLDGLLKTAEQMLRLAVIEEDHESIARYIRSNLQIMDRRAKYLGLDTQAREESLYDEIERLAATTGMDPKEIANRAEEIVRGH